MLLYPTLCCSPRERMKVIQEQTLRSFRKAVETMLRLFHRLQLPTRRHTAKPLPSNSAVSGRNGFRSLFQFALVSGVLAALPAVPWGITGMALGEAAGPKDVQQGGGQAQAYLVEGKRELQRRSYPRSIRLLTAAIQNGSSTEAYKWRGKAYDLIGDRDKAVADFNYYISLNPSDPEGYCFRGDAAATGLHHDQALRDYHKALELAPSWGDAHVGRGLAYLGLESYQSAAQAFEAALKHDPGNPDALINLGLANMLAERPNRARQMFRTALETERDSLWKEKLRTWISALPDMPDADFAAEPLVGKPNLDESKSVLGASEPSPAPATRPVKPSPQDSGAEAKPSRPPGPYAHHRAAEWNGLSGTWQTSHMGAQITLEINQSGSILSGVMRISGLGGKTDVYHFTGSMDYDGGIRVAHHSGHVFEGRMTEGRRLVGVLTTKYGKSIPVDFGPH